MVAKKRRPHGYVMREEILDIRNVYFTTLRKNLTDRRMDGHTDVRTDGKTLLEDTSLIKNGVTGSR